MKKQLLIAAALTLPAIAYSQSAFDVYRISQPDMKGTARFMSMGGAFGALGGDLSTLSQNPAGIGVYRRSEIGFTLDLSAQSVKSTSQGYSNTENNTRLLLNNIGGVATYNLNSSVCPNINFGFTYNKAASFNRKFSGVVPSLSTSVSNYMAGVTNGEGATVGDLTPAEGYDPYFPTDGGYIPQWSSVLGYQSYMISPVGSPDSPTWIGQWGNGTSGKAAFETIEQGSIDEYNISIGGNIANVVFWGMDFGITDLDYRLESGWTENLKNAYVNNRTGVDAETSLYNYYRTSGTGFNYKIGLIIKPIQALRLGFAVHTPTWYSLDESFYGSVYYNYSKNSDVNQPAVAETNGGYDGVNSYRFRSPWKFIGSIAGVIGSSLILSADYEWTSYTSMELSEPSHYGYYYDDPWFDDWEVYPAPSRSISQNDPYYYTNKDIDDYFTNTSTLRVGAEYRVTPQFSVRAGYCYVSSPVKPEVRDNQVPVYTVGTNPQYVVDRTTNYITCGLGYKYQKFYIDAAYVYKHTSSDFHAFPNDVAANSPLSPSAEISNNNSQIVLSMGFKF